MSFVCPSYYIHKVSDDKLNDGYGVRLGGGEGKGRDGRANICRRRETDGALHKESTNLRSIFGEHGGSAQGKASPTRLLSATYAAYTAYFHDY